MCVSTLKRTAFVAVLLGFSVLPGQAQVNFGADSNTWARDGECDDPRFVGDGMATVLLDEDAFSDATDCRRLYEAGRITLRDDAPATDAVDAGGAGQTIALTADRAEAGRLAAGDETLGSGEYRDLFTFEGRAGEFAVLDLQSSEFDPYLMLLTPSGDQEENDDYEGDGSRSQLALTLEETGTFTVGVTSYEAGETGAYTLELRTQSGQHAAAGPREEQGELAAGDETLESGEYMDLYRFEGRPGQRVAVDLRSGDFDTYVILVAPNGDQHENDDAEDGDDVGHSRVESELSEAGAYEVLVTSYEVGEVGQYALVIDQADAQGPAERPNRDVANLAFGRAVDGTLEAGDLELEAGEYEDLYVFDGAAGDSIRVELTSTAFDTYVMLTTPDGDVIANDDHEGSTDRSVVEFDLPQSGRYRVAATSYEAGETGPYRLLVNVRPGSSQDARVVSAGGRTFGVFIGISDYPGTANDLDFTADDAVRVHDAMARGGAMRAQDSFTLTDANATTARLRDAIASIAAEAGPDDTFVLFYSGHGNRLERASGPDMFDPDSLDETIELYDGPLRDDELRILLEPLRAGTMLLLLDSCFSGGFAKDLISRPGRMGMFSSEEDVTSQVAVKFRAGGYLAYFFDEAVGERLADEDGNGEVTALELSEYIHLRYRNDVKASSPDVFVRTGGPQSGYQHLVVDRGSIGPYDVLFR